MFIKSLKVENFKGFENDANFLEFRLPDGVAGSGLNIFIGENNCGKSTVLEAIDFLRNGTKKDISSLKYKNSNGDQLNHASVEVEFTGKIDNVIDAFSQQNKKLVFKNKIYLCSKGNTYLKLKRTTEDLKVILLWDDASQTFENVSGLDSPLKKLFETNFIWADTNPNDEASFGASTICGFLLSEIAKIHKETNEYEEFSKKFHDVFNSQESELRQKLSVVEDKIKNIFQTQFGSASISFEFEELKIESFFKNSSIMIDDGIKVPMTEKGNGMQRSVALALLQVYAEVVAFDEEQGISKPFYLFIDEPEICLHPKGQQKLFEALLEISKHRQVFVTTHSPYFLSSPYLKNIGLYIFKKSDHKNNIEEAKLNYLFPWSPTWGELNFKAYDLPTVDLHNELYGYLQDKSEKYNENTFEAWLLENHISKNKIWTKEMNGVAKSPYSVTLMTFIRNHIHHPENLTMKSNNYTSEELLLSINQMIGLIEQFKVSSLTEEVDLMNA
ncbi:AAA family ATPase [Acinetobacter sp. ANC 5414]|uniref:ATP-dependent nuclease n=1 Tax=Acinetobacter sp. ANC 5414 TaxID=2731251 RepID=UPI00148F5420|nr:AAA family ATPase [Acinetobacter sp. ANC 5414]NNH00874.1 AAA family ATPase [Acinetobacter sp. ANC 5414]